MIKYKTMMTPKIETSFIVYVWTIGYGAYKKVETSGIKMISIFRVTIDLYAIEHGISNTEYLKIQAL